MPSKMPPQLLALMEEFKARAAIAAQRNAADTTKHTAQITQHPPITAVDIERMKQELGLTADPNAKPFADGGAVHMLGGGLLGQYKGVAKGAASNAGINAVLQDTDPMSYAGGIGSMFALYHAPLNADEVEMDKERRLDAQMDRAGYYRQAHLPNPAWKNALPQFNPQEIIANYPNWKDIPPVEKARILKNFEDYKKMVPSRHQYDKGGKVKKDTVDLARRSIFGLRPEPTTTHLPAIVHPPISTPQKSIADIPLSRRSLLQSAAGQALRGAMPMGEVAGLAKLATPIAEVSHVVSAVTPQLTNPLAIAASLVRNGASDEDIAKALSGVVGKSDIDNLLTNVRTPESYMNGEFPLLKRPSESLHSILHPHEYIDTLPPLAQRPALREIRSVDPDLYRKILDTAKDTSMVSAEEASNIGLKQKWIDKYMKGEIEYDDLPKYYKDKADLRFDGFGYDD